MGRSPVEIWGDFSLCTVRGVSWGGPCPSAHGQESGLSHPSPQSHYMEGGRVWRWLYLPTWVTFMNIFCHKPCFLTIWSLSSNGCICLRTVPSLNNEETAQIILGHSMHHNAKSLSKCSLQKTSLLNCFYIHGFNLFVFWGWNMF